MKKCYFAGPDVFKTNAKEHFENVKLLCEKYKLKPLIPMSNSDNPEQIYYDCLGMMNECDVVAVNITSFRGPSCDVGTAFELGYLTGLQRYKDIKIVKYTDDRLDYSYEKKVKKYYEAIKMNNTRTIVEDFGLIDNLMITVPMKIYDSLEEALSVLEG